ncbi:MAG: bifunctional precorrin-2 dehydrogenase/sirohydrochlorin ferrochelatase [Gemmata sp.]|jgi:precorrin-2 dehydrogenase/sirohydrochlorin ferrochelatase
MLPLTLNLRGRSVVVIGGGNVGARKAAAALAAGATVRVVDPRTPLALPPDAAHAPETYRPDHLDGAALAFACATPDVNARVATDARAKGVWVSSASAPDDGDFTLPAVVRRGDLLLTVSTGGASPALARRVREKLESEYDGAFAEWVRLLAEVRQEVLAAVPDEARRRELLDGFAGWEWLARLRADGAEKVREALRAVLSGPRPGGGE